MGKVKKITAQEFLQDWEKKNNTDWPYEMKWTRKEVNDFAHDYDKYLKLVVFLLLLLAIPSTLLLTSCAAIERGENAYEVLHRTEALMVVGVNENNVYLQSFPGTRDYRMRMPGHAYQVGDTLWLDDGNMCKVRRD